MQNYLEDYIRISNIKTDSQTKNPEKEELVAREKYVQNYAQKIVELLLDGKFEPQILLKCLNFINHDYYLDIVEERMLLNICGYALCGNMLSEIPAEQYYISTKHKKVYDIIERKNFCSNYCYQASDYIKHQIDNSPLWLRKPEDFIQFKLLPFDYNGRPGIEVYEEKNIADKEKEFTSASSYTQHFLNNTEESNTILKFNTSSITNTSEKIIAKEFVEQNVANGKPSNKANSKHTKKVRFDCNDVIHSIPEEEEQINESQVNGNRVEDCKPINVEKANRKFSRRSIQSTGLSNEKDINAVIMKINQLKKPEVRNPILVDTESNPEIKEMFIDENIPKYSERIMRIVKKSKSHQKLKQSAEVYINSADIINTEKNIIVPSNNMLNDNSEITNCSEKNNKNEIMNQTIQQIKKSFLEWITLDTYIYLYGQTKVKEILTKEKMEKYFDKLPLENSHTSNQLSYMNLCKRLQLQDMAEKKFDNAILEKKLKPLPNYNNLKVTSKQMDIKVKSFFAGSMYENNLKDKLHATDTTTSQSSVSPPVIQAATQDFLRKKIFIKSFSKYLRKHIQEMDLEEHTLNDIICMVKTFHLEANNIMFNPATWNIIALIFLIILSFKDKILYTKLKSPEIEMYINEKLYKIDGGSLLVNNIIYTIENVDIYVEQFITQS